MAYQSSCSTIITKGTSLCHNSQTWSHTWKSSPNWIRVQACLWSTRPRRRIRSVIFSRVFLKHSVICKGAHLGRAFSACAVHWLILSLKVSNIYCLQASNFNFTSKKKVLNKFLSFLFALNFIFAYFDLGSASLRSSHVVMVGVPAEIAVAISLASFLIGASLTGMLCCIHHRRAMSKTVRSYEFIYKTKLWNENST